MNTITLKFIFTLLLITPFSLFAQGKKITTEPPAAEMEVNGIIFSSRGGVKFPDGTIQTTAYVVGNNMMQMGLTGIVMKFPSSSSIIGPANAAEVSLTNGINILSLSEGMSVALPSVASSTIKMGVMYPPNMSDVSFSRQSDVNSAQLRNLAINNTVIDTIDLYNFSMGTNSVYYLDHFSRYINCQISSISNSSSDGGAYENVSFQFAKVCYHSYQRDASYVVTRRKDSCFDIFSQDGHCECGTFPEN